ncbi:NADAR family protein [Prosthecobacter sp.]|uniref:NADAR family protein n=1 Tax=Prosthecobacter sp. TaxID=1965333 RepID=UPI003784BD3D
MLPASSDAPLRFYSTGDAFGEFSNFAPFPVKIGGKTWPTSEHYFQAQKFQDAGHAEKIRKSGSPMMAARLGRNRKAPLRKDWEAVKIGVMRQALLAKFTQHAELRELLFSTGERRLIESTPNDDCWGDGGDGSGKNMLGRLLMEIRAQLRKEAAG